MKRPIDMSSVEECTASRCAYNQDNQCYAKAITVGGSTHPACDTFISDDTPQIAAHVGATQNSAGVGACKTMICRHNKNLECGAPSIRVKTHAAHADCNTFEA